MHKGIISLFVDKIKNKYRWHFWFKCKYDRNISNKLGGIFEKENIICLFSSVGQST